MNTEDKFGKSTLFMNSSLTEEGGVDPSSTQEALLKEAIHVMSCSYEDRTLWGYEVHYRIEKSSQVFGDPRRLYRDHI